MAQPKRPDTLAPMVGQQPSQFQGPTLDDFVKAIPIGLFTASGQLPFAAAQLLSNYGNLKAPTSAQIPEGIQYGMIPTSKNLEDFNGIKDMLKGYLEKSGSLWSDAQREAMSYMMARYPNRFNSVEGFRATNPTVDVVRNNSFEPDYPEINPAQGRAQNLFLRPTANPPQGPQAQVKVELQSPTGALPQDFIPTIAHESQHGMDYLRNPDVMRQSVFERLLTFIDPNGEVYRNQNSEIRARQAGRTALDGYKKYLELQGQQFQNSPPQQFGIPDYYSPTLPNTRVPLQESDTNTFSKSLFSAQKLQELLKSIGPLGWK